MLCPQCASGPRLFQLAPHPAMLRNRQPLPLDLRDDEARSVLRVRCHEIQLQITLPIAPGAGKGGSADILEDRGRVVVDQFPFL